MTAVTPTYEVRDLLGEQARHLQLSLLAGESGLGHRITSPRIQKPGLALAGLAEFIHPDRVQVLGNSEISFLASMALEQRREILGALFQSPPCCFLVTKGLTPTDDVLRSAEAAAIPILRSPLISSEFISRLTRHLEFALAPQERLHGVLLDLFGVGVLLLGESGVGKSECALDLIVRGHRLVADDVVVIRRMSTELIGMPDELIRDNMELRGIGIVNVKNLFGVSAVRDAKTVELAVELEHWRHGRPYDRTGLEERQLDLLGTPIPKLVLPVAPGRNLSILVEVAARNHLLAQRGIRPARELERKRRQKALRELQRA